MPGFRVKIGFGLHAGWAVEGPIGSSIKVDCSYLGPHQDMVRIFHHAGFLQPPSLLLVGHLINDATIWLTLQAERLETATKIYGVGLLVSDTFYDMLSPERKRNMRTVDRVLCDKLGPDGQAIPVRLYAVAPGGDEGDRTTSKKNAYSSDSEDGMEDYINGASAYTNAPHIDYVTHSGVVLDVSLPTTQRRRLAECDQEVVCNTQCEPERSACRDRSQVHVTGQAGW
jgi:hypothetical protein